MNDPVHARILAVAARRMRADFDESSIMKHAGSKGSSRERVLVEFLSKYMPSTVEVCGSAEIVSADGQVSPQCDVVIYDPAAPLLLKDESHRIIPAECVYAVIEVKSKLTWAELEQTADNMAFIKRMPKTAYAKRPLQFGKKIYGKEYNYAPTMGYAFAFSSDGREGLWRKLCAKMKSQPLEERLDAVWLLGDGAMMWFYYPDWSIRPHADVDLWFGHGDNPPDQDVLLNVVSVLNTHLANSFLPPFDMIQYVKDVSLIQNFAPEDIDGSARKFTYRPAPGETEVP